jgi:homoserine kinase type II
MAVYTKISEEEASEFLQAYDLGQLQELKGIRQGVENTNYFLTTTQGRYVLTLYEKRVHTEDLPFFIGLMDHLAAKGLPSPKPQKTKSGTVLGHLAGRNAVIISFLPGHWSSRVVPSDCAELGRALARMHVAVADFPMHRANALTLPGWEKMVAFTGERADEIFIGLSAILEKEIAYLKANWPTDLPRGIIHADLFPDNVLFDGKKLCGMFDFYFACDDFYAYDLAICLNAWCFENQIAFNITKAKALLSSYEEIRPLSQTEKNTLPILARGSALRFLLTRLHVKQKDPLEYLTRLQFHQMVSGVSAYGLDA